MTSALKKNRSRQGVKNSVTVPIVFDLQIQVTWVFQFVLEDVDNFLFRSGVGQDFPDVWIQKAVKIRH